MSKVDQKKEDKEKGLTGEVRPEDGKRTAGEKKNIKPKSIHVEIF